MVDVYKVGRKIGFPTANLQVDCRDVYKRQALSLQMGTRQSEALDFMKWRTSKTEKMEVAWYQICLLYTSQPIMESCGS